VVLTVESAGCEAQRSEQQMAAWGRHSNILKNR
jgi:hypothetical protein